MGIRLQPRELDIPDKDPFRNDLLSREEPAKVLTHLVESIEEGPCVLAVDAEWGAGKTTFLKLWAQHLRNSGFPVVELNAWETDHSGDPFVTLSSELAKGLEKYKKDLGRKIRTVKTAAAKVLRYAIPGAVRLATAGIPYVNSLMEEVVGKVLTSYASTRLARYETAQKSIETFKSVLQEMANNLFKLKGKPLMVFIDELDRCRPTYAVEFLEVAKHIFSVESVVFVMAVNHSELAHSIRTLYGHGFNAEGYLQRFFDADFRLPAPERKAFIEALLHSMRINVTSDESGTKEARSHEQTVQKLLTAFFGASEISLREIAQAIHRLGLVFASLSVDQRDRLLTTTVALILRTLDSNLYRRFRRREVSDSDVVASIFKRTGDQKLQRTEEGEVFESIIIAGFKEQGARKSSLLDKYEKMEKESQIQDPCYNHACRVARKVRDYEKVGFLQSVQLLELVSEYFINDASNAASHDDVRSRSPESQL